MHKRYLGIATGSEDVLTLKVRVNSVLPSENDKKQMDQVVEIECELVRRWRSGYFVSRKYWLWLVKGSSTFFW
jgi:hypothetical protein